MAKSQKSTCVMKRKTPKISKIVPDRKKSSDKKAQGKALIKSRQPDLKQLVNYRNFIKYLLYSDIDHDLADDEI